MIGHDDADDDLRESFGRLRSADQAEAPSFASLAARRHGARSGAVSAWLRVGAAAAGLAVAAYGVRAALTWTGHANEPARAQSLAAELLSPTAVRWNAPTDFLLDVPGARLLRTAPSFGWGANWLTPLPGGPAPPRKRTDSTDRLRPTTRSSS